MQNWVIANFPDWRPDDLDDALPPTTPPGSSSMFTATGDDVLTAFVFQAPPSPNDAQIHRLGRKFTLLHRRTTPTSAAATAATRARPKTSGTDGSGCPRSPSSSAPTFFQGCSPSRSTIYPDNLQALLYAARAVRAPYTQSSGPEVARPAALPSAPNPGETVDGHRHRWTTRVSDPARPRRRSRSKSIAAAEIYVDVPPWQAGAVRHPHDRGGRCVRQLHRER